MFLAKGQNDSENILYATKNPEHYLFVTSDKLFSDNCPVHKEIKFCIHDKT